MTRRSTALLLAAVTTLSGSLLSLGTTLPAAAAAPASPRPTELLRWQGDTSSATGAALGNGACDVNGDGLDDAVVGAWFWDKAPADNIGAAYVLLGDQSVHGAALATPATAGAVRIDGPAVANAFTAFAVGCLGDVNGDGFDDIGISHYTANKVYVVLGSASFTRVDLGALGDRGYVVSGGATATGNLGFSLAPVGDVNDDGLDDFGIGEVVADTRSRTNNGRMWIVAGQDAITGVDLSAPAAGQVLTTIDGASSEERLGQAAAAGDVNGDGIDDILLGSYTATPWGSGVAVPGAAYVVWGGGPAQVDLAALGTAGFRVLGPKRQRDRLGISVAGLGDLDGDGKADLLLGADGVSNATTGPRAGAAVVVFGSASTATVYTDPTATSAVYTCANDPGTGTCAQPADATARGYWVDGAVSGDATGYSVAGLPDLDGDGRPELLVGAYGYDPVDPANPAGTLSGAGAAYVVYGKTDAATQSLASLPAAAGYRVDGLAAGDRFGRQVAALGDLDGNGHPDFGVGADFANRGGAQAGEVTVALVGDLTSRTVVTTAPATVPAGDSTRLVATVTRPAGAATTPTGNVTFRTGDTTICAAVPLADGAATCAFTPGTSGTSPVVATYDGATGLAGSTSAPLSVTATARPGTLAFDPVAAATYGTAFALTTRLTTSGAPATGSVAFTVGGKPLGSAAVTDGVATLQVPGTAVPPDVAQVVATYSGDAAHAAASAVEVLRVDPAPSATSTNVRKRRVEVTVAAGALPVTGRVRLVAGEEVLRSKAVVGGRVTLKLPRGKHRLVAVYAGSATVAGSRSAPFRVVVK